MPPTCIMIVGRNWKDARPVIVQRRIDGAPLCRLPLKEIFRRKTARDLIEIIKGFTRMVEDGLVPDICGQKVSKNVISPVKGFVFYSPFFSDNIMVDNSGHAWLTDNDRLFRIKGEARLKRALVKTFFRANIFFLSFFSTVEEAIIFMRQVQSKTFKAVVSSRK